MAELILWEAKGSLLLGRSVPTPNSGDTRSQGSRSKSALKERGDVPGPGAMVETSIELRMCW